MPAPHPLSLILDEVPIPVAYKIGYVLNKYREPSFRGIEARHGLTRPEILSLIFLCWRDGITAADICDFSGHLKNNISRGLSALERKGLVRRQADPADQRRLLLYITPAGRALHDGFMPALQRREQAMVAALNPGELAQLQDLLRKLCAAAPDWSDTDHAAPIPSAASAPAPGGCGPPSHSG